MPFTVVFFRARNTSVANRKELGNLGLTGKEEEEIVAFMGTLSDGYPAGK